MRVLIAGGGIAGSVTAVALERAGIESTIFESHAPTDADVGSYFTVAPNGLDTPEPGTRHDAAAGRAPKPHGWPQVEA